LTTQRKGAAPGVAVQSSPGSVDGAPGRTSLPGLSSVAPVKTAAELPDRRYFRIGEVAGLLGVKPYVLRYWETEFPQVRPQKSRSGQRLYRRREVEVLLDIRHLLYERGFTIAGARKALKEMEEARLSGRAPELAPMSGTEPPPTDGTAMGAMSRAPSVPPQAAELTGPPSTLPPPSNGHDVDHGGLPSLTPQRAEQLSLALAQADSVLLEELRDGIRDLLGLCKDG
jgi:DNA-binding transcriptional MerR regulator